MPIKLNGSTSGYTQISAPATAGNNTLTLPTGNGTNGQFMQTDGSGNLTFATALTSAPVTSVNTFTGAVQSVIVAGTAVASTSGTSITFTGIPSWVKRITVMFNGVSTNGSSPVLIQIGSGSVTASGYLCGALGGINNTSTAAANYTTGFGIEPSGSLVGATVVRHGIAIIANVSGNIWTFSSTIGHSDIAAAALSGGTVTLSGTLDRVVITTVNGTDTFDAGSINILYE